MDATQPTHATRRPAASTWERLSTRTQTLLRGVLPFAPFSGALQTTRPATAIDVVIDFQGASYEPGTNVYVAIWASAGAGPGRQYRAQYQINPPFGGIVPGIFPAGLLDPTWSRGLQSGGLFSNNAQYLIQAFGIGATNWGVDIASLSLGNTIVTNLKMMCIAHGRET